MQRTFLRFPGFKDKALTLSYDDGVRQDKRLISIMQKNGIKGTFNLNSGLFSNAYTGEEKGQMTIDEAVELYSNSCMEVAVHGVKHLSLDRITPSLATADILNDRITLERIFGKVIKGMAYANGLYSDNVVDILKICGINYSRTVISTEKFNIPTDWLRLPTTCHHNNPKLMELAKEFFKSPQIHPIYKSAKLFYLWGHSYEFDNNNNWNVIEEFCEFMGNREDVWYATNGEIFDYVTAFDRLEFSANGELVYNPSAVDVYITYGDVNTIIPAGKTVKFYKFSV